MANERDEVLLDDPNDSEFSGFGPDEVERHSGPIISTNNSSSKKKDKKGKKPSKSSTSTTAKSN